MPARSDLIRELEICAAEEVLALGSAPAAEPEARAFAAEVFGPGPRPGRDDLPFLLWQSARALRACPQPAERGALGRLVARLERLGALLLAVPGEPDPRRGPLSAMVRLADLSGLWLRPVEEWDPCASDPGGEFSELLRHLLACYPVPLFMDSVFSGQYREVRPEWFHHVGTGQNIRTAAGLPARLTCRMAHHMMEAPDRLDFVCALRRGQVLGLGGDEDLGTTIGDTVLGRRLGAPQEEEWWAGALQWCIYREIAADQYPALFRFLDARRREDPSFSLKGRTLKTLFDLVRGWQRRVDRKRREGRGQEATRTPPRRDRKAAPSKPTPSPTFKPSGYRGGTFWAGGHAWSIHEVLNIRELGAESRELRHCVLAYEGWIREGRSSIWSLRKLGPRGLAVRAVTVEVNRPSRSIVQARGAGNRLPTRDERQILELWAAENGLRLEV